MTKPTIEDDIAALSAAIDAGPTPGPWRWEINRNHKSITLRGGRPQFDLTIMDFDRWGMGGATITLRDPAVDGMNIMHRLPDRPDWIAPFPNRAHHAHWCASVKHPDTAWIEAASPDRIARLIAALQEARAELSQPARVGLTEAEIEEGCAEAGYNSFKAGAFYKGVRFAEERHNIPAEPTQERAR